MEIVLWTTKRVSSVLSFTAVHYLTLTKCTHLVSCNSFLQILDLKGINYLGQSAISNDINIHSKLKAFQFMSTLGKVKNSKTLQISQFAKINIWFLSVYDVHRWTYVHVTTYYKEVSVCLLLKNKSKQNC